jgi:carbon-monoxide dehydrogenase large subunit
MSKIVHINRTILARLLEWPEDRIRMVELSVGGGFGARGEFYPEDFLVPWAAIKLQRPVNWTEDREEHLRTANHSREQVHEISLALDQDGMFLGLRDRITFNTGAYVRTHGVVVPNMTAALLPGPYVWGAYSCEIRHVVSNKTPAGTYRAPGRYEANFARERMIDITARRIGAHPDDLRRRNLIGPDLMPYANGAETDGHPVKYDSGDYPRLFQKSESLFCGEAMEKWRREPVGPLRKRGIGSAFFVEKSGIAKWDYARVEMGDDGRPTVFVGSASLGQGLETVIAQICADALGVAYDDVEAVRHGDTDEVPEGMGSFGSRATMIAGSAVFEAAEELRRRLLTAAAHHLEASETDLSFDGARVIVNGSPSRFIEFAELRSKIGDEGLVEESRFVSEDMSFPYGVHRVAVEVDVETGALEIEKYSIAYDVGRAINPMLIDGQIVGGAAQGIGGATLEEFIYDEQGQLVTGSFIDYLLPTATEIPNVEVLITEDAPTPLTPVGAKGAGEGGTAAAGAAIANAVCDALGVELLKLPLTPERVRRMALGGS